MERSAHRMQTMETTQSLLPMDGPTGTSVPSRRIPRRARSGSRAQVSKRMLEENQHTNSNSKSLSPNSRSLGAQLLSQFQSDHKSEAVVSVISYMGRDYNAKDIVPRGIDLVTLISSYDSEDEDPSSQEPEPAVEATATAAPVSTTTTTTTSTTATEPTSSRFSSGSCSQHASGPGAPPRRSGSLSPVPNRTRTRAPPPRSASATLPRRPTGGLPVLRTTLNQPFHQEPHNHSTKKADLGQWTESVRRWKITPDDLNDIVDDDEEFQKLKDTLKKKGAITNEVLRQGLHFYVKANRDRKEKREQRRLRRTQSADGTTGIVRRPRRHHRDRPTTTATANPRRSRPGRAQSTDETNPSLERMTTRP